MTNVNNPLLNYFRQIKTYTKLPSGTSYYTDDIIDFTESGEIPLYAMTGKDELLFKNPDALLNGQAMIEMLRSCAPTVKKPEYLLVCDVDAIMAIVRHYSYEDNLEIYTKCPKCKHENTFKIDLSILLNEMQTLEESYSVNLDNNITIFVKPHNYKDYMKVALTGFEQQKILQLLDNKSLNELDRYKEFSKSFDRITKLNYEMINNSIIKVVDSNAKLDITNDNNSTKKHIAEFLQNIDRNSVEKINDLVTEINDIGIKKESNIICQECEHEWDIPIEFNPVNFFTDS